MSNRNISLKKIMNEIRESSDEFVLEIDFSRDHHLLNHLTRLDFQLRKEKYEVFRTTGDSSGKLYHIHCRREEDV